MPLRFLRPGLTDSSRWNSCDWDAQSFYVRLITAVDDYGRFDADVRLLKGHLFALREDVTLLTIANMCQQLQEHGLSIFYTVFDKPYLQLTNWQEKARSKSKYPEFSKENANCKQLLTIDSKCLLPSPSPSPSPTPRVCKSEQEVEPSPNFPKTPEAAVVPSIACPTEFVRHTWNKAMARGGRDSKDIEIRNWSSYLATEWKYEQERLNKENYGKRSSNDKPGVNRNEGTFNKPTGKYHGLQKVG